MMEGHLWHIGCLCSCVVMEGYLGHRVLMLMYSDGGSFRTYRVFIKEFTRLYKSWY